VVKVQSLGYGWDLTLELKFGVRLKGEGRRSTAVRNTPHRYGNSHAIWDHTVLPATRQR